MVGRMASKGAADISSIPGHLLRPMTSAVISPVTVVAALLVMEWRLGVALLAGVVLVFAATRLLSVIIGRSEAGYDAAMANGSARVVEFALNQQALRVFGRTVHGNELVEDAFAAQRAASRRMLVTGFGGRGLQLLAVQALLTVVVALSVHLVLGGTLAAATAIGLLVLSVRFVESMVDLGELSSALRIAQGSLRRVLDLLETSPLPEPSVPGTPRDGAVEMNDVSFSYDGSTSVLDWVDPAPAGRSVPRRHLGVGAGRWRRRTRSGDRGTDGRGVHRLPGRLPLRRHPAGQRPARRSRRRPRPAGGGRAAGPRRRHRHPAPARLGHPGR
jgi:ATP-binding cassette subfamily B protein